MLPLGVSWSSNLIPRPPILDSAGQYAAHDPSTYARIIPLIERIYDAAAHPHRWNDFISALSRELGDPAIVMNLEIPNRLDSAISYRIHSEEHFAKVFADLAIRGEVPWPMTKMAEIDRFVWSEEYLTSDELEKTEVYRRYMQPQDFLSEGQCGHVLAEADGRPLAAIGIYRRKGGRPITPSDAMLLDPLVPHLRNAYAIHCELSEARYRHLVTSEAIDRFPIGVLFIDRELQVVDSNRAADRIAAHRDGFSIIRGVPQATGSVSAAGFLSLLGWGVKADATAGVRGSTFSVQRPSGRQPYQALVAPLLSAPVATQPGRPVAVVFIADPEDQQLRMPHLLAALYNLTGAESDLAVLLSAGHSIEDAAKARNVTANTVRSQLKKVFAKTGVSRQTDLVRLLTASVAALERDPTQEDD